MQAISIHHQKQLDQALTSRQSSSPHHHARVAAAAARTGLNPDGTAATNGTNSSDKPSQWTVIDIGGMQIKNISKELFRYTFLTTLYLNHNALSALSPDISKLINLVRRSHFLFIWYFI